MTAPPTALTDAPPDWPTLSTDLTCPLCGYNLRGLADPRCPECGFAFRWGELLDAKRDRHPWLFEHGRGRNVRTFLATYVRTPLPRRFWRSVTPANPVHLGRLLLYWLVASLPLVAIVVAPLEVPGMVIRQAHRNLGARATFAQELAAAPPGDRLSAAERNFYWARFDNEFPPPWSVAFARQVGREVRLPVSPDRVAAGSAAVLWPWLSAAALMVFQTSLRRARVNPAHVLRAAVYGCDFGLLICIVAVVVFCPARPGRLRGDTVGSLVPSGPFPPRDMPLLLVVAACAAVATYRLSAAYAQYLRFPRPVLVVAASQVIVLLTVMLALSWTARLF
jgi:hypothetical protein